MCNLDLSLGEELEDKEDDDSTDSKLDTLFSPVIFWDWSANMAFLYYPFDLFLGLFW